MLITEDDVASFRRKLDEWVATLGEAERVIVDMIAVRAFPDDARPEVTGFEVEDYSFDIEQVLSIGSTSSGGGSGKAGFNPFSAAGRRTSFGPGSVESLVGMHFRP